MKWTMAVKWSLPVWVVTVSAIGASMVLTDFGEEIGTPAALKRVGFIVVVGLPLIACLITLAAPRRHFAPNVPSLS
jgi:hypothetical protein